MDVPRELEEYMQQLACSCGTVRGRGFMLTATPEGDGIWCLTGRCLRCGRFGHGRVRVASVDPVPAPVSDISTDEVIDLHEALKSDDWLLQLTGKKP